MSFEYKIAFQVSDPVEINSFLDRLRKQFPAVSGSEDFMVTLESDGFYFCDYIKSERSSCAFRRLVDEALHFSEVVIHEL